MLAAAAAFTAAGAAAWQSQPLNTDGSVTLRWNYDDTAQTVALNITAALKAGTAPGWLGVGFSPDGAMRDGDYIYGYLAGGSPCVRTGSNGDTAGMLPTGKVSFTVSDTAVEVAGETISVAATRTFAGTNPIDPANPQKVLFAAGSAAVTPANCTAALSAANHHDLGGDGFVGAADVSFSGQATPPPTPAPAPLAPPALGAYCSVKANGFAFPANMTVIDAAHFSYYDPQLSCASEEFAFVPATGALDISEDLKNPSDCFAKAANKTSSTFMLSWNGTHMSVANSLFPGVFLVHRDIPAGGSCPPPS